jgi:DNA mismatch repair protein MutS
MSIKEWDDSIIFMHKIMDGEADKSYGIHVAKLAGLPLPVTKKATKLLSNFQNKKNGVFFKTNSLSLSIFI